ncbi:hypothetical protein Hanom_Chr04g00324491 [Helianthus anomalus]
MYVYMNVREMDIQVVAHGQSLSPLSSTCWPRRLYVMIMPFACHLKSCNIQDIISNKSTLSLSLSLYLSLSLSLSIISAKHPYNFIYFQISTLFLRIQIHFKVISSPFEDSKVIPRSFKQEPSFISSF